MAKSGAEVVGIEVKVRWLRGLETMLRANGCSDRVSFFEADLFETDEAVVASWGQFGQDVA